jgi:hypothetical protein
MTKNELLNIADAVEVAAELTIDGYDLVIIDLASLDDDGWQCREAHISKAGLDDYQLLTHGNGYDGYNVAPQCGYPTVDHHGIMQDHTGLTVDRQIDLAMRVNDACCLSCTDWSLLEQLKASASNA